MTPTREDQPQAVAVHTQIITLVTEMSPVAVTTPEADAKLIADLGYDSLALLELVTAIEDALDLDPIDDQDLEGLVRVGDLERIVKQALGMPSSGEPT